MITSYTPLQETTIQCYLGVSEDGANQPGYFHGKKCFYITSRFWATIQNIIQNQSQWFIQNSDITIIKQIAQSKPNDVFEWKWCNCVWKMNPRLLNHSPSISLRYNFWPLWGQTRMKSPRKNALRPPQFFTNLQLGLVLSGMGGAGPEKPELRSKLPWIHVYPRYRKDIITILRCPQWVRAWKNYDK